jgi:hypothetical protein
VELETALATAKTHSESRVLELETALASANTTSVELETALASANTTSVSRVLQLETALASAWASSESRVVELETALATAKTHSESRVLELETALTTAWASSESRVVELETALATAKTHSESRVSELETALATAKTHSESRVVELEMTLASAEAHCQARVLELESAPGLVSAARVSEHETASFPTPESVQHTPSSTENQLVARKAELCELKAQSTTVCNEMHVQSIHVLESVKNDHEIKILESKKELRIIHQCYSENKAPCADKQSQHDTVSAHLLALGVDVEIKQTELRACQDECMKLQDVIIEKNVHICELDKVLLEKNETLHIMLQGVADDDNGKLEAMAKLHQIQSANNMQAIQHQESLLANAHTEVLQATTRQDELVKEIELLMVSFRDYTGKLQKVQTYTHALSDACLLIKNKFTPGAVDTPVPEHITILHILELLENFVSWFEFTYISRLYEFTCILSQSELE